MASLSDLWNRMALHGITRHLTASRCVSCCSADRPAPHAEESRAVGAHSDADLRGERDDEDHVEDVVDLWKRARSMSGSVVGREPAICLLFATDCVPHTISYRLTSPRHTSRLIGTAHFTIYTLIHIYTYMYVYT